MKTTRKRESESERECLVFDTPPSGRGGAPAVIRTDRKYDGVKLYHGCDDTVQL